MTKLTEFQKKTTIPEALKKYMTEMAVIPAQLSRISKVSEAYLTHILRGDTSFQNTVIADKYYLNLCRAIGFALKIEVWRHFNTQNFKQIVPKINENRKEKIPPEPFFIYFNHNFYCKNKF